MASKVIKIIGKKAKEFNKLRDKLTLPGMKYILLENTARSGGYTRVLELTDVYHRYSNYREMTNVQVARNDLTFINALYRASDIAIGANKL